MRPPVWRPPVALSPAEQAVVKRIRRAKLFVWLREHRHRLLDDAFQAELAAAYQDSPRGHPPVPPAQLALATILQAYTGASDDEVIEATVMDRRWQLVLDCWDAEQAPFGKATLVGFRARLIAHQLDRRLVEQTVALAKQTGGFGVGPLRAALDSSPLWGAGRVEDTINLMGHALRKALGVLARQQGWGLPWTEGVRVAAVQAGVPMLGASSLKAALDCDWDDAAARQHALVVVVDALDAVEGFLVGSARSELALAGAPAEAAASLAAARQVCDQDVHRSDDGTPSIRQGVAKDRRISIEDAAMRHGRKTKSVRVDGYKRHVLRDLDSGLVPAVGVTPANLPEASVTDQIAADLAAQHTKLAELHIDRAYLSSTLVRDRDEDLQVFCKAFPVRNGPRFTKTAFGLDFDRGELTCPAGVAMPFALGGKVQFPAEVCAACPLRTQCTTSTRGRSVQIHPDERLLVELRAQQLTPQGRAKLRERVQVEHALAHVGHWQGRRARYLGVRKNLFDLRRVAVVHNLHVLARQPAVQLQAA
jgi:transposase